MPASRKISSRNVLQPAVVLLEEYGALSAAIGAALRKFAPKHQFAAASSIAEAAKLVEELRPELILIDVDPPWAGITDFVSELRQSLPESRSLVIGAQIPQEIASERGLFGAIQFIEKPFELQTFGAAVQALLGPWNGGRTHRARGLLGDLSVADVVLLHCAAKATVMLEARAGGKNFGEIYLAGGEVVHAKTRKLTGADAFQEILGWREPLITEDKPQESVQRTIGREWPRIFLEALRPAQPAPRARISPAEEPPKPKTGKKIVVVDDTEMLLIFVEDVLSTTDPELQITTALTGSDGVAEVARIKPDLVLLDYSLPDFNGDEVCRRLLQDPETANVPILMMSGHVPQMRATAERFQNVVATIEKPFLSDALVDLVTRTLRGERQARPEPIAPAQPTVAAAPVAPPPPVAALPVAAPPRVELIAPPPPVAPLVQVAEPPAAVLPPRVAPVPVETPVRAEPPIIRPQIEPERVVAAVPTVRVTSANEAVLGLFLDVVSMQLTPQLQMGAIRAKPSSPTVSLRLPSAIRDAMPPQIGFQLGVAQLDASGRLSTLRLVPTARPYQPAQTRNAFEIGGVSLIPNHVKTRVQLTPAGSTPMTVELLAHLELAAVELSSTFQMAQLVLKWPTNIVRVTLNPKAPEQTAARFEASAIKLEPNGHLAELLLNPIR